MAIEIRRFRRDDVSPVLELANSYTSFDGTTSEADLGIVSRFPEGFWVAKDDGKLVGFVYGYFNDIPEGLLERWKATKVGHVELMAVAPSYRRRGVGKALLTRLLREFEAAGADMVLLDARDEMEEENGYGGAVFSEDDKTLTGKLHVHMGDTWRFICRRR